MQASSLNNVTTETFAGGLNSGLKLGLCLFGSLSAIILSSPISLGLLCSFCGILALGAVRPLTLLKVCMGATVFMSFTLCISWLLSLAIPDLMRWNAFSLGVPYLRMLVSVNLLLMLSTSTPVQELFNRMQRMHLPRIIRIPISVAIRFIPTFMDDCGQIRDASRLRPGRGIGGIWRTLAVPLIFRTLFSADDLAVAAELKGIGQSRPLPKENKPFGSASMLVLSAAVLVLSAAVLLQIYGPQFAPLRH